MTDTLIVSVSGLRGIVGGSLTPEVAVRYARAFVDHLPPGPIVLGRDGRAHGGTFAEAITLALLADGREGLAAEVDHGHGLEERLPAELGGAGVGVLVRVADVLSALAARVLHLLVLL